MIAVWPLSGFSEKCVDEKTSVERSQSRTGNSIVRGILQVSVRLQLHGAIYRPDSFLLMLRYCANLKAIRYESVRLNRIVADKSHRIIAA